MNCWSRQGDEALKIRRAVVAAVAALLVASVGTDRAFGARQPAQSTKPQQITSVYRFLVSHGVPIDSPIRVAKLSAVIRSRFKVRSVVKIIGPDKLPDPEEIEELRKTIERKKRAGVPVKIDLSKRTSAIDLLRHNILTGEVAEFRHQEKLGDLELFFSEDRSLKIEIGTDLFLIIVGKKYCAFRSPGLRRQLNTILETRKAESGGNRTSRSRGSRPPR